MSVGLPVNITVIWIHTRKNSRLSQNKFPLILAVIDITALLTALPLLPISHNADSPILVTICQELFAAWQIINYVSTLLLASIDKLYAVMRPFKYKLKRGLFVKISLVFALIVNSLWSAVTTSTLGLSEVVNSIIKQGYALYFVIRQGCEGRVFAIVTKS